MKLISIFIALFLVGCGSTPYRDDYAKHVNLLDGQYFDDTSVEFSFIGSQSVDLRGLYQKNDTANASPILYQAGGGLIGMLAQIGTHSTLINSQRNEKLAKEQEQVNQSILPLINISKSIMLTDLVEEYEDKNISQSVPLSEKIRVKPIFFSNRDMTEFSLTSIVWLPSQGIKSHKQKFKYKNLIQVYSKKLNLSQQEKLIKGDTKLLAGIFSSLLNTALFITKSELTGTYSKLKRPIETFIIQGEFDKKVIRGSMVAEKHGYQIVQDLHSWLIAYPKPEALSNLSDDDTI
jgi:hypothetical protein